MTLRMSAQHAKRRWLALVVALACLGLLAATVVLATHDAGLVEMDGNVADDGGSVPGTHDWNTLFNSAGGYIGPAGVTPAFEIDHPTPDFTYHAGSDKDQHDVSTWQCKKINNPTPKDEILNAYAALYTASAGTHAGDQILSFGFERPVNNGTSFMGVWFFQSDVSCDSAPSGSTISFTGAHSPDDILTLVNFSNGGANFSIQVFKWVGTGGTHADGTLNLITSSGECGPSELNPNVCGKVNTAAVGAITTNWLPGSGGLATHQFFEGTINLNELLAPGGGDLPCFSTFLAETRTSDVFTAQLKDFASGPLDSCGNIIVQKETDPDGDPATFDFTADYDADGFTLGDGGSNDSGDLSAGTYSVTETVPEGWDLTSSSCDDGSPVTAIVLTAGETVTCTFNNQKDAVIIVQKETDPDGDPATFDFTADYDADGFTLGDGGSNDSGDLDPGNYTVAETVPDGWDLTSATCDNEDDPSSIDLAAGETVTCTFNNQKDAVIIIEKVTSPDPDPSDSSFDFSVSWDSGTDPDFDLKNGESENSGDLDPGTYSASEDVPAGWSLTSSSCDNGDDPSAITIAAGDTVTCTFTNTRLFKIIVITCDESSGELVDSLARIGDDSDTAVPTVTAAQALADLGLTGAELCVLTATFEHLSEGIYDVDVELPDIDPVGTFNIPVGP